MRLSQLALGVTIALTSLSAAVAADPVPLGKIALSPGSLVNYATSSMAAEEHDRFVFVRCDGYRSSDVRKLHVVRTADWSVVGSASVGPPLLHKYVSQSPAGSLFYDAKECKLSVISDQNHRIDFPTDLTTLGELRGEYKPSLTTELVASGRSLPEDRGDITTAVRRGKEFWTVSFTDTTPARLVCSTLVPKRIPGQPAAELKAAHRLALPRKFGFGDEGVSHVHLSAAGNLAVIAVNQAHLDPDPPGKELTVQDKAGRACVLFADAEKMVLTGGVSVDSRGGLRCTATSPDAAVVACGGEDGTLHLIDVAKRRVLGDGLQLTTGMPLAKFCFSPDGKYLVGASSGQNQAVNVVEVATGKVVFTGNLGGRGSVINMAFGPKGNRLYTLTFEGEFFAWDFPPLVAPKPAK